MAIADFSSLRGQRVLVTGSTGFKGSWLCSWLLEFGADVTGLALPPHTVPSLFEQLELGRRIDQRYVDIRDFHAVMETVVAANPTVVLHLAAQPTVLRGHREPKLTLDTNIGGTTNILEAARTSESVRSLVVVTSDKCYRNVEWVWGYRENDPLGGQDPYSASKAGAELVYETYNESFFRPGDRVFAASARAGNVIGGGDWSDDRIVPDCIRALLKAEPIPIRNPTATRPWQHVLDPLHGYLMLAGRLLQRDADAVGSWNFGPTLPANVTVLQVAEQIVSRWGKGTIRTEASVNAVRESNILALDSTKAMHALGWYPRWKTSDAIDETADWYRAFAAAGDIAAYTTEQLARFTADT